MSHRGVVISPFVGNERSNVNYDYSFDPLYLRQLVIFWDKIDCPDGRLVEIPLEKNKDDLELLANEGIFIRTKGFFFSKEPDSNILLRVHHDNPVAFWSIAQQYTFYKHILFDDKYQWTLSQSRKYLYLAPKDLLSHFFFVESGNFYPQQTNNILASQGTEFIAPFFDVSEFRSIELDLVNALIFPAGHIPMEMVLEFKRKRIDELLRFRHAMDEIYLSILSSDDIPIAKIFAIDKLKAALIDINKVMKESFFNRFLSSIKVQIDSNRILNGIDKGKNIGAIWGMPEVGAIIGGVLSLVKITDLSFLKPRQIPVNLKDYAYLYYIHEELK